MVFTATTLPRHSIIPISCNADYPAKKYCFRATARVLHKGKPCGIFTAFDASVDIVKAVENACQKFIECEGGTDFSWEDVDLAMYLECPIELTGDIYFARLLGSEDTDDVIL